MKKLILIFLIIVNMAATPIMAGSADNIITDIPVEFDPSKFTKEIKQVEEYLSSFKTLTARFNQTNPVGYSLGFGKISISRPGKVRWEYANPFPSVLIIEGKKLIYHDLRLDQVTYSEVPDTPLEILLYNEINFKDGNLKVLNVVSTQSSLSVMVGQNKQNTDNEIGETLVLVFRKKNGNIKLERIHKTNENGHTIMLKLIKLKLNEKIDDKIFKFKNPRTKFKK